MYIKENRNEHEIKKRKIIRLNDRDYEIVDKIPSGFFVWDIGGYMESDEYIPLCERLFPGAAKSDSLYYRINTNTLKAIKLPEKEVKVLRDAASWDIASQETAEKALKSKGKGYISEQKRKYAAATVSIFNRITEK